MKLNNTLKVGLIIQIQIIFILVFILLYKVSDIDRRIFNTNKFVHEVMVDKRIEALKVITEHDIVLGNKNAPVTMFFYSRFDCSACNKFIQNTLPKIENDFISTGEVKFIIRYLTHPSKQESLYATKCAYYMNNLGLYNEYSHYMVNNEPDIDSATINSIVIDLVGNLNGLNEFVNSKESHFVIEAAKQAREVGIKSTPTILINDEKIVGTRPFERYRKLIETELENVECD